MFRIYVEDKLVVRELEAGLATAEQWSEAWPQRADVLRLEGEVRRAGCQ